MASFLKILLRNVLQGPSTDPFPAGETFTPPRLRGKVKLDPERCMGCRICYHTCSAGAINITQHQDGSGYDFTVWHNSCCLCANCRLYCPTKAITLTDNWHSAHEQTEKYTQVEQHFVPFVPCTTCGQPIRPLPADMAKRIYAHDPDVDPEIVRHLCPKCRLLEDAKKHMSPIVKAESASADKEKVADAAPKAATKAAPEKKTTKQT